MDHAPENRFEQCASLKASDYAALALPTTAINVATNIKIQRQFSR